MNSRSQQGVKGPGAKGPSGWGAPAAKGPPPPGVRRNPAPAPGQARKSSFDASARMPSSSSSSSLPSNSSSSNLQDAGVTSSKEPVTGPVIEPYPAASPVVMPPVSQITANQRLKPGRVPSKPEESPVTFDPEHYNCDGSPKTMYVTPNFASSYAQAMNARYCRHPKKLEREQELTIQQIFDK